MVGTDVVAPPGKIVASMASPTIKFGAPLDFSRYEGMEGDRLILRAVTDEIMYKIMELSGQYIDMYATKAKQLEGRAVTGAPGRSASRTPDPSTETEGSTLGDRGRTDRLPG